jgi:hypothetical protein
MTLTLLGAYAFFCVVIGIALGYYNEGGWVVVAFLVAGVVALQVGFFAGLVLRG